MARQGKTLPARRESAFDDSLLIRSAESLGRMIGSLQRQLDAARQATGRANGNTDVSGNGHRPARRKTASPKAKDDGKAGTSATKARSAADRTSKRASKSAAAKKTASRNRSGAKQRAARTRRRT
jgi:hypothetical protein